jgi:hypothetical protein
VKVESKPSSGLGKRTAVDKGMLDRLKDQLAVQKHVEAIRANPRLLKEMAFYPAHDKRSETPLYKKAHNHLTQELDLPCLVCGVKNSTLKSETENRYGAKAMAARHRQSAIRRASDHSGGLRGIDSAIPLTEVDLGAPTRESVTGNRLKYGIRALRTLGLRSKFPTAPGPAGQPP